MNKTVLHELIEWLDDRIVSASTMDIIKKCHEMLPKERQQIIDAYNQDLYGGMSGLQKFNDGTEYYNKTYNNE